MGEDGPDAAASLEPVHVRLLTPEQLAEILEAHRCWALAFCAGDLLEQLGFPPEHNQSVRKRLAGFAK